LDTLLSSQLRSLDKDCEFVQSEVLIAIQVDFIKDLGQFSPRDSSNIMNCKAFNELFPINKAVSVLVKHCVYFLRRILILLQPYGNSRE